jgi:eukaryotic-like serine/threonine-protein kinase
MDSAPVKPGDVLAGKYRVERVLGAGGIGVVVAATHLTLDQQVALKFLLPTYVSAPAALERFAREARAAAKLKSEHVARVLDTGMLEDGAPYIVMEYLEGADLSHWIAQSGRLPLATAVDFVLQACEALAEAHAVGIVHRDLKPANLFVTAGTDGSAVVKILDFGIAKTNAKVSGSDHSLTATSAIVGSPLYMSPEQLESSRDVDHRTDIWALGAILYELTTGELPFSAPTLPQLCVQVIKHPARPPSSIAPDLPPAFDQVVAHCLEKAVANRFESVQALSHALLPFARPDSRVRVERISRVSTVSRLGSSSQGAAGRISGLDATIPMDPAASSHATSGPASTAQTTELLGGTSQSWGSSRMGARRTPIWPFALAGGAFFTLLVGGAAFALKSRHTATADPGLAEALHSAVDPSATGAPPSATVPATSSAPVVAPTAPSAEPDAAAAKRKPSTPPASTGTKRTPTPDKGTGVNWNSRN